MMMRCKIRIHLDAMWAIRVKLNNQTNSGVRKGWHCSKLKFQGLIAPKKLPGWSYSYGKTSGGIWNFTLLSSSVFFFFLTSNKTSAFSHSLSFFFNIPAATNGVSRRLASDLTCNHIFEFRWLLSTHPYPSFLRFGRNMREGLSLIWGILGFLTDQNKV